MSVVLVPGPQPVYLYRLGDILPTTGITIGSVAVQLDTGLTSDFADTAWVQRSTSAQIASAADLADVQLSNRALLREVRLLRQGMIKSSTCAEYDGPPEELDD